MGKSDKSSDGKNVDPAPIVVLIAIALICSVLFVVIWENEAYNVDKGTLKDESKFLNSTSKMFNMTSYVSVVNYFPFRSTTITTRLAKVDDSGTHSIPNNNQSLQQENIVINSYTYTWKYGDKELRPPMKVNNPQNFPNLNSFTMCNTTVVIEWGYNASLPIDINEVNRTSTKSATLPRIQLSYSTESNWLPQNAGNTVWLTLFFLAFVVSGLGFSWYFFGKENSQKLDLMRAYGEFVELPDSLKEAQANTEKEDKLKNNLRKLFSFPSQIGFLKRLFFGLSILIFRIVISNNWKKHKEKISSYITIPYRRSAYETIFSKYNKDQPLDSVRDALPELKTVVVAIGFLTTIGITFSWNIGAAAPFVFGLILFYFFFNLGSTFYFVGKSRNDLLLITFVLVAAILVISFPNIISMLRIYGS